MLRHAVAAVAISFATADLAHGQTPALIGRIVDTLGVGIPSAAIEVAGGFWQTRSTSGGAFELRLLPGQWELRVRAIGYRPYTVILDVPHNPLVIQLISNPIELKAVSVVAAGTPVMARTVTPSTVRQLPPLGEPDIFRAAVFLPAVSQPNDLKGRIHLAGGSSDETGIRLDGHPLEDPFHLLGVLGAFNVAALDRADVLIHHVPAALGGKLSGSIELTTRRPAAALTEIVAGILAASVTTWRPIERAGIDILASGRVTYLDKLLTTLNPHLTAGGDEIALLGYSDALLRIGRSRSNGVVELIGFTTRDHRRTSSKASPPYAWGESLLGIRLEKPVGTWALSARTSFNRASADLRPESESEGQLVHGARLRRDWTSGNLEISQQLRRSRNTFGLAFHRRTTRQSWENVSGVLFSERVPHLFANGQRQLIVSPYGETTRTMSDRANVSFGARASYVKGRTYVAPSTSLVITARPSITLSATVESRNQFDAEIEEPAEGTGKQPLFLLNRPRRAHVAAVSLRKESPGRGEWEIAAFTKLYRDRAILPDLPAQSGESPPVVSEFPAFERVAGRSQGVTIGATRWMGTRSVIQGAYTFQRVTERVGGGDTPTSWDAPHAVSLFGSSAVGKSWHLNAAVQLRSGAATTPVALRILAPGDLLDPLLSSRYVLGSRNSGRLPAYQRLDIGLRREWRRRRADFAFSAQVLNLLARSNTLEYNWSGFFCQRAGECSGRAGSRTGLPILPSLGLEVKW